MRVSSSSGRVAANENDVFSCSLADWIDPSSTMGVIYCHGGGGDAYECREYTKYAQTKLVSALSERFVVVSADLGGARTYGNDTVIAAIGRARNYLVNTLDVKPGKIALVGASMGFQSAAVYARAHPTQIAAIVGFIPLCDLTDIHTNNRAGATADINTAYGGAYSEATYGAAHNPVTFASQLTMPIQLWYASDDTAVIPSTVTAFDAAAPNCTINDVGALGHTEAAIAAADHQTVIDWLASFEAADAGAVAAQPNLLTANQSSLESNTTGWAAGNADTAISRSASLASHGNASLRCEMTNALGGSLVATTPTGTSGIPVTGNAFYTAMADVAHTGTARSARVEIVWYTAAGATISGTGAGTATDTASMTERRVGVTSPSNAAFAALRTFWSSTLLGEVHHADRIGLFQGYKPAWEIGA